MGNQNHHPNDNQPVVSMLQSYQITIWPTSIRARTVITPDDGSGPYAAETEGRTLVLVDFSKTHSGWGAWLEITADGFTPFRQRLSLDLHPERNVDLPDVALLTSFPGVPTREQVCKVQLSFAGLIVDLPDYPNLHWFEAALISLSPSDRQIVYNAKKEAGDTHCIVSLSWNYDESPSYSYPVRGCDLTGDLLTYCSIIKEVIKAGFTPLLMLPGDGMSPEGGGYVNSVGWTYGYQWVMNNLERIINFLKHDSDADLTKYCIFCPGYDSVFYGWDPNAADNVDNFAKLFRSLLSDGYLALENSGVLPLGEGGADFTPLGRMGNFDTVLLETEVWPSVGDSAWQILGRLVRPYNRPSNQPQGDDPNPPFYIGDNQTVRGPWFIVLFEPVTYADVRGYLSHSDIINCGQYYKSINPDLLIALPNWARS